MFLYTIMKGKHSGSQKEMALRWEKITHCSYLDILNEIISKNYNLYSVSLTICKILWNKFPQFYRKILYRALRLLEILLPNSFWKLLTFRNEHVDLGVKEEDMQKTEELPIHNAAGN